MLPQCRHDGAAAAGTGASMKLFEEYVAHALAFDRLAAEQSDQKLRAEFEQQAAAYRKLAVERAAKFGLPSLSLPQPPKEQ
jgi:hypothetical protein